MLIHLPCYSFRGTSRLAKDAGLAKSTVSQVLRGRVHPLYGTVRAIIQVLEFHLGRRIDPDELFSKDGIYPTPHICTLIGCTPGCLPDTVFTEDGSLKPEYQQLRPGQWTGDVAEFRQKEV